MQSISRERVTESTRNAPTGQATAPERCNKLVKSVEFLAEKGTELELLHSHQPLREVVNSWRTDKKQKQSFIQIFLYR